MSDLEQQRLSILGQYEGDVPEHAEQRLREIQDIDDAMTPDSEIPSELRPHTKKVRDKESHMKTAAYRQGLRLVMRRSGLEKRALDMDTLRGLVGMETAEDRKRNAALWGGIGGGISPGIGAAIGGGAAEGGRSAVGAGLGSLLGAGALGTALAFPGSRRLMKETVLNAGDWDDAAIGKALENALVGGGLGTMAGGALGGAGGGYLATE